jgi:dynein heavy chain 1
MNFKHHILCLQIKKYVKEWLCYQALWDLQADNLYGRLGSDITMWMKCQ